MKSYLSLIPISARVHRRQNRMTLLCIIFAVFMVTAVFSMAEMGAKMEQVRLMEKHGDLSLRAVFESSMGQSLLLIAIILFLLILFAGVLMISGSINSSVAQRTKLFGMMRCIGMSRQQIIRFVRLEALNWCKTAVPIGLAIGIVVTWGLCAALRFLVGDEFSYIPLFGISGIGIVSGIVVGVVTVLIAAQSPAKRAAKVSPIAAVSGNSENTKMSSRSMKPRLFKIETALGIHHAVSAKKNLFLMTGSFALSIVLFLSFSVLVDFVGYLMPQSAAASDIDISSGGSSAVISADLPDTLRSMEGVKQVYGRRSSFDIPAVFADRPDGSCVIDLISFDEFDLEGLQKDGTLMRGGDLKKVYGENGFVLATSDRDSTWGVGDKIRIGDEELEIAGLLRYDPFSDDGLTHGKVTLIASGETFVRITGITDYSLVMVKMAETATDDDVEAIHGVVGSEYRFNDKRDERTAGTYMAFVACVYAFLAIITLVTVLNIVNSISMSVSARVKQYGSMRAVGMDERQVTKMIAAEAFTYALWGCTAGCVIGLPLSKMLYDTLIASHFQYASWVLPIVPLGIILAFVVLAAAAAAYAPAKRMRGISVTETINDL
ncbi:ABC transporter permease [Clostridium botulinum]|uniref:ABC transporter permease n=1 Tax=Clostridium botulinum TaxID=1491 RepID=UPI00196A18C2|nr:ABC transporter permease [Clostridium botulinum]MBN3368687.1 ABC transporter permease [Clostridium botulinum]MBN3376267.1 ABC transporter permease [Clostridium botulinum]